MTQEYFDDNVNDFNDLREFCIEEDCEIADSITDISDLDEYVCEDIRDNLRSEYWYELRDELNNLYELQCGDWFIRHETFDYTFIDDCEFEDYKDMVRRWAVENDIFDEEIDLEESDVYPWEGTLVSYEGPEANQEPDFEVSDLSILFMPA